MNKIILVALVFAFAVVCISVYNTQRMDHEVNLGKFTMESKTFSEIVDAVPEGSFTICDIEKDECVYFNKQPVK